jgi:rubrerythrin
VPEIDSSRTETDVYDSGSGSKADGNADTDETEVYDSGRTEESSDTVVYSAAQDGSEAVCPNCETTLASYDDPSFCPDCGAELERWTR